MTREKKRRALANTRRFKHESKRRLPGPSDGDKGRNMKDTSE